MTAQTVEQPSVDTTSAKIGEILEESFGTASKRRGAMFDQLAEGADRPIVLYGAGGLGRLVLDGLRRLGHAPVAFADRKVGEAACSIDGLPAFTPGEAARRFGSEAVFVVCIWNAQTDHRFPATRDELLRLGVRRVAPALALFWKFPDAFLPYYCLDVPEHVLAAREKVERLARELVDDASRDVLLGQLRWRLQMNFNALPMPVDGPAYFQPDLLPLCANEVFVDCGAYDGDTLRAFQSRMLANDARVVCIEPDPDSYARLERYVGSLPSGIRERVRIHNRALGTRRETLLFDGSGTTSARLSKLGTIEVESMPLDDILDQENPTLIKMDLEGAEIDALLGGENAIRRAQPSMAVCVYHRPGHLWEIPLLLREMLPDHGLHLRPHGFEGWDLVCYAIAPGRK